jgi:serine/threonine protein kinase
LTRDEDARLRLIGEAKAASALDHPNICTVHDIDTTPEGQSFIAMSFYDGETLKEAHRARAHVRDRSARRRDSGGVTSRSIRDGQLVAERDDFQVQRGT